MVRVHIVNWANRKRYRRQLERLFRIRHKIYVEQRKWRAVARPVSMEIDAFDTEDAIYLLALDVNDKIVGGSRLVPTLKPHLMSEIFPMLAPDGVPRGPLIYEWTRFFIIRPQRSRGKSSPLAGIMLAGMQEVALKLGLSHISVVCESYWPGRLRALGWKFVQLGEVLEHPDGDIVALLLDVSADALANTRRAYGISQTVLADPLG